MRKHVLFSEIYNEISYNTPDCYDQADMLNVISRLEKPSNLHPTRNVPFMKHDN